MLATGVVRGETHFASLQVDRGGLLDGHTSIIAADSDAIAMLKERYDVPALFFHDSVFSLHRKRTVEIERKPLYAENVESIEAVAPQAGGERVTKGIEGVRGKNQWWSENHEIHSASVEGPWPHGDDRFAVRFSYDVTNKPSGMRMQMDEIGLFTLEGGKVVKEEFFYTMGG